MSITSYARLLGWALAGWFVVSTPASADLIFDNTTRPLGAMLFTGLPIGNEVRVEDGGLGLSVTQLEIGVNQQGTPGTADLRAFLYANDGADGAPGTLLWSSAIMTDVGLTGGNDLIAFAVPSVAVPNIFTWAIQISNAAPVAVGIPAYNPPVVGNVLHSWFKASGGWSSLDSIGASGHFGARISATVAGVPEPSTIVSCGLSLATGLGWNRLRGKRNRMRS